MTLRELEPFDTEPPLLEGPEMGERSVPSSELLTRRYGSLDGGVALMRPLIEREFPGRLAVVPSFGAESAVILAQIAEVDRDTPILFLDTGR